jgi:hypothetical protein
MNFRANSTFKAGDWSRLEQLLVPKLIAGATAGAAAVLEISQGLVAVATGALKASGKTRVEWTGQRVTGYIVYGMFYAGYVEFGTGRRGAASPGAGPFPYRQSWPGMAAQPYCRPALDIGRSQVLTAWQAALGV